MLRKDGRPDTSCAEAPATIQAVIRDRAWEFGSTYHSEGGSDVDCLEDSNVYVDLGEEAPDELEKAITEMIDDAKYDGLSDAGVERLRSMIGKYPVFGFGKTPPVDYHPRGSASSTVIGPFASRPGGTQWNREKSSISMSIN